MEYGFVLMMAAVGAVGYRVRGGLLQDEGQEHKWYNGTFTNRAIFITTMVAPFAVFVDGLLAFLLTVALYISISLRLYPWQYMQDGDEDVKKLALRGLIGTLPVVLVLVIYSYFGSALLYLLAGPLLGPTHYLGQYLARTFPSPRVGTLTHGNNLSEYLYGVIIGAVYGAILLMIS